MEAKSATPTKKWEQLRAEDPGKKRDFQIRAHIIEARDLQPRDSNGMSDPVCVVKALTKKQNTKTYQKTTICTWDHLMFFEYQLVPDEFFLGKIKVSVFDANTIARDVEIGAYEFDVGQVYNMDGHELYRKWVALTDSTGKTDGVQGYLKLSITVLGPGDIAPAHNEDEENEDDQEGADLQSLVLLPPSIKTQQHALEISIYKAESLPKMDIGTGKCDGYVAARYGGNPEIKTEVVKNTYNPQWLEKIIIPVTTPTLTDLVKLQVKDWDAVGSDEVVATAFMSFNDVSSAENKWKTPRWVNLYGTPEGVNPDFLKQVSRVGQLATKMNDGYIDGTAFRGRMLMSAESKVLSGVKLSKHKINAVPDPAVANYVIRFDLYEVAELQTKAKIAIEVTCGAYSSESKKVSVENGTAAFYKAFDDIVVSLPKDKEQMPDIFINVVKHSKVGLKKARRIGFLRIKPSEINNSVGPRWELIQPDIFREDEENIQIIGFIQFRIQMGLTGELQGRDQVAKPKLKKFQLRAHIYQGRELPAADANGVSDPYCVVRIGKFSLKTKVIKKTIFPLWYETLQIPCELPETLVNAPDINVSVFDWDQVGDDDYMGRFSVPLSQVTDKMPEKPKWYPIYMKTQSITEGEILASFQLIPDEKVASYPVQDITPKYKDCVVEASVIGIRNMLPYRLLPVSKPYVEFDCGGDTVMKTKISDNPNGANPNYLETLNLEVKLPSSRLFAPPLNIRVYDDRVLYKALVATRSISLAPFITWDDSKDEISVVPLDDDTKPRVVDKIPGAKDDEVKESKAEVVIQLTPLEEDHVNIGLMNKNDQEMQSLKETVTASVDTSAPSKVAESYLPGAPAEPEEEKPKRETTKNELELFMKQPTFDIYKMYRAKKKGGKSIKIEVGTFKGRVRVYEKAKKNLVDPPIDLVNLYKATDYVLRAYILEGFQLVPKDRDGKNNPYIRIKAGKTKIKDLQETKQNTSRPQFFKCYEVPISFPANGTLDIAVYDHDKIGKDEMIGSTIIDLENRIFSNEWKSYQFKPIEFRTLWTSTSSNPQGQLKLWIDILTPEEARKNPPEPIAPPTPIQYELRAIIWETRNVVFKDKKSSDIFVIAYPEGPGQKPQSTDTHWRSEDGTGSFNWRMKFPLIVPNPTPRFKIQVWDKDLVKPNDSICEANLNLKAFYLKSFKNKMESNLIDKEWLTMTHPAHEGVQGEVLVSLELLTQEEALRKPAGYGRKEPNDNPHLDEPKRPELSFNPLRLDKQLSKALWGQNKGKIKLALGACCCCIIVFIIIIVTIQVRGFL